MWRYLISAVALSVVFAGCVNQETTPDDPHAPADSATCGDVALSDMDEAAREKLGRQLSDDPAFLDGYSPVKPGEYEFREEELEQAKARREELREERLREYRPNLVRQIDNSGAPMPFGRSMHGPWEVGRGAVSP